MQRTDAIKQKAKEVFQKIVATEDEATIGKIIEESKAYSESLNEQERGLYKSVYKSYIKESVRRADKIVEELQAHRKELEAS